MVDTIEEKINNSRDKRKHLVFVFLAIIDLLSLLAASCFAAGGVEEFQCPGGRADAALTSNLSH